MQLEISYHNTTKLTGQPLADAETHCRNQEERVMYLFRTFNQEMTPSEVFKRWQLVWPVIPLTSVRRAMSNLTKRGELEMLDDLVPGIYAALEHKWRLAK
jgi:hypothetical protein